ncbi:MAG: aspartate aminotransferase family protein [Bacteroidetes bacterium]|nr:MAG: aspartate aminotransferase family protein [Bacteroidota bacterium]
MQLTNRQLFLQHVALPSVDPEALEVVKAKGIYLYTDDNNKYIDLVSGVSVSNVGHLHPKVVSAVKEQLDNYMHLMVYGKYIQSPQVKLAALMADNLPKSLDSVFFVNSGSEAIEGALKLAKRVTERTEIVSFKNAYHGSTHGALSVLGNEEMKYAFRPLLPDIRFIRFNQKEDLALISSKTAAVIVEPIQAEAGIIIPESDYLKALRQRCDETGTLLIFDEVQMGFGRTGKLFAFENFEAIPDILCLAKGMGGGMPIGAFVSSRENMSQLTFNPALGHITTFGGHPVSAAAALASLKVILDESLAEKVVGKGRQIKVALQSHPAVAEIRQIGLMLGIELKKEYTASDMVSILKKNKMIVDQFLFSEHSFRIAPPLTITEKEIDEVVSRVIKSLDELMKAAG